MIGGSKVAVEYASFYRATGTPTTIVSRGALLSTGGPGRMDDDLRHFVIDGMQVRGIELLEHSTVSRITGHERVEAVEVATPDGPQRIEADFVLIATGEQANVESFIGALPVDRDDGGFVTVNSRMQTSVPGVYAAGDLLGPPLEMFKSRRSGTTAARNIMGLDSEFHYADIPDFLHTTYEVSWAGLSEREARQAAGQWRPSSCRRQTSRRARLRCRWPRDR